MESSLPQINAQDNRDKVQVFDTNFNATTEANKINVALNADVLDIKTIVDIITHRSLEQRLEIEINYKNLFKTSLSTEIGQVKIDSKMRDLILVLLSPFPKIDNKEILNTWLSFSNSTSKTLQTIEKYIENQMTPLEESRNLLQGQIDQKLSNILQQYEAEAYKNATYDPKLYAYYLYNALNDENKIVASEILTKCNEEQLLEVATAYNNLYKKDLKLDISEHFQTDLPFRDVILTYLTLLPELTSHFSLNTWNPMKQSKLITDIVNLSQAQLDVLYQTYETVRKNMFLFLKDVIRKHMYEVNLESLLQIIDDPKNKLQVMENSTNFIVKNDIKHLQRAFTYNAIDVKTIVDIASHRSWINRLDIEKQFVKFTNKNFNTYINETKVNGKLHDLLQALFTALPVIDNREIFNDWISSSKLQSSNILSAINKYFTIQMKTLHQVYHILEADIEQNLIRSLQLYETEFYKNLQCDSSSFAIYLQQSIENDDKNLTSEFVSRCNSQQLDQVANAFKQINKDLKSDISKQFKSNPAYHDIIVAYVTAFPDFAMEFSMETWIPELNRSQIIQEIVNSSQADMKILNVTYENIQMYVKSFLLEIMNQHLYEGNLEASFPMIDESSNKTEELEENTAGKFDVIKDVKDLNDALKNPGIDTKTLVDIITHRNWNHRLAINNKFKEINQVTLIKKLNSLAIDKTMRNLIVALLSPFPKINNEKLYNTWMPVEWRLSDILNIIFKYVNIQLKYLNVMCQSLRDKIELALITALQHHESELYDPLRTAVNLHKAIEAADKPRINTILTKVTVSQRLETVRKYKSHYDTELFADMKNQFVSPCDGRYLDIIKAYLAQLPPFRDPMYYIDVVPQIVDNIFEPFTENMKLVNFKHNKLEPYVESELTKILQNALYDGSQLAEKYYDNYQIATAAANTFNVSWSVQTLDTALQTRPMESKDLLEVLTKRHSDELYVIAASYEKEYNKILVLELEAKFKGPIHDFVSALMTHLPFKNVQMLFNYWIPIANRQNDILDIMAKNSNSTEIQDYNQPEFHEPLENKLKEFLQLYTVQHLKALEVAAIFPSIHFDAANLANELFKLMQQKKKNYKAIKQLLSPFSNEQRTEIIKALTKKANGQKLLDNMRNISSLETRLILSPMPVSDEEEIFKQWFGLDWNKNSNVISKILKYFSSTEILNFSALYEQLKQNIEYSITTNANITQEVNLESYKLKPKSVNESLKNKNYADNLTKYLAAPKNNEKAIVDLFLANGNNELYSITKLYNKKNKDDLITEIRTHVETQLGNILIALLKSMPDFVTSWLPFSNVKNSTIDKSCFDQMEAAKKAHNALWFDIDLQLRNILKFHIWQSQRLETLNSFLNEPEKNYDDELCSKNIQDISNAGKTKERQTIISEMLPLCNIKNRLEITNAYKKTHQTDLIANHAPSNASYLNDVAQALLTPFPVLNNDDLLRLLLPNEDLNTKQLNILKYFSFAEIEDVHKAYEQLYLSIESNLKSILQNHIWDNENLIELYNFFNEIAKGPELKYAMEIYDKWLPSSRTHSLWSRFSYKYLKNLEEACERLRLYLQQRLRLFTYDDYITLDANESENFNQLIGNANTETKHCKDKHPEYVEKFQKTLNLKSGALKANIMDMVMQCDNNDMIKISKLYTKLLAFQLPQSLNNVLPKNYFHDLALSLFAPYPSEYNVESSYKYWLKLWNETEILQNSMQTFKSKLQKITTAYENMKLTVQKKILFILRNRLWENDVKLAHMLRTIDKMSSGFRLYENEKESKWEQNIDVSLAQRGHNFYPGNDVQTLTKALNGKLLNIQQISNVLINRSYNERMIIAGMEKSLPIQIDNKLTDIFGNIPKALMTSYPVEQAWTLFDTQPLSQLKCTDILKDMKYLVFDHITAFNAADKDVKVFIETEIKKGLMKWRNPKCLKIKTSPSVPSIRPAKYIHYSEDDAKKISKAIPNQVAEIIDILTHRSTDQRFHILGDFYQQNRIGLKERLINSFTYRVKDITSALVMPYGEFMASAMQNYAVKNPNAPYIIIDFLATATYHEIQPVKHTHANMYGNYKFDQFYRIVTTPFKGVAVKMVKDIIIVRHNEREDEVVLDNKVDADATFLFQLGENKYVRSLQEEERIANIFAKRSRQFLLKLFDLYEITYKECIESAIKERGLHRDLETLVLAIIQSTKSTADYFADRLYEALSGNHIIMDNNLIRILVTRSQIDLHDIHERFDEKYGIDGKGLLDLIMSKNANTDYMKALCAIIKPTDETP